MNNIEADTNSMLFVKLYCGLIIVYHSIAKHSKEVDAQTETENKEIQATQSSMIIIIIIIILYNIKLLTRKCSLIISYHSKVG